jgi:transposase InsO family protein
MAESFVDTIKTELLHDRVFPSRRALELAVIAWIGWYNHDRLHSAIGDKPPADHERAYATASEPAA